MSWPPEKSGRTTSLKPCPAQRSSGYFDGSLCCSPAERRTRYGRGPPDMAQGPRGAAVEQSPLVLATHRGAMRFDHRFATAHG